MTLYSGSVHVIVFLELLELVCRIHSKLRLNLSLIAVKLEHLLVHCVDSGSFWIVLRRLIFIRIVRAFRIGIQMGHISSKLLGHSLSEGDLLATEA